MSAVKQSLEATDDVPFVMIPTASLVGNNVKLLAFGVWHC